MKTVEIAIFFRRTCRCQSCKKWSTKNPVNNTNKNSVEIRPDIIIHKKRGNKSVGNIVAIEIKKKENCLFDQAKLKALTSKDGDYKYKLGVFIYFSNDDPKYKWFVDGLEKK